MHTAGRFLRCVSFDSRRCKQNARSAVRRGGPSTYVSATPRRHRRRKPRGETSSCTGGAHGHWYLRALIRGVPSLSAVGCERLDGPEGRAGSALTTKLIHLGSLIRQSRRPPRSPRQIEIRRTRALHGTESTSRRSVPPVAFGVDPGSNCRENKRRLRKNARIKNS